MTQRIIAGAAILVLGAALVWLIFGWNPAPPSQQEAPLVIRNAPTGGDFQFESSLGPVRLSDLRGKVVTLYFGYTWCPDICPTGLGFLGNALSGMEPDELEQVQPLFVSVDPERDDLERLAKYTVFFHPAILGVTGDPAELKRVADAYGAAFRKVEQKDSAMGYVVDHTADLYLIGRDGRLARTLRHGTPPGVIRDALRELLAVAAPRD